MERRIYEAAVEGNIISLLNLLQEDALILDRITVSCYGETPLHIASMLGHAEFVQEILGRKPELAGELDSRKSSPLHLATSKGYLDIVKKLVSVNPEMCLARDRDGKNPVHIAVIKGRVSVLKELVKVRPIAARMLMERGETILHACVRFDQLEAMKFLMEQMSDHEFVNSKDDDGNTVLHLAVADKQVEAIQFLTTINAIEVNALNKGGFTALDILKQSRRDWKDYEIGELLRSGGDICAEDIAISKHDLGSKQTTTLTSHGNNQINMSRPQGNHTKKSFEKKGDWLKEMNNVLMVIASLISTVTFQAGLNPPGGVWQETKKAQDDAPTSDPYHEVALTSDPYHEAGESIMADTSSSHYYSLSNLFFTSNTIGFVASLCIILLLVSGLPFIKRRLFTWILMVILWVAISALTLAYLFSQTFITGLNEPLIGKIYATEMILFVWMGVMGILLLSHTIRLIKKIIIYFIKLTKARRDTNGPNGDEQCHNV
ncbi:ankyrin repeat-containing protein BDA1-like [Pistacia vera]|uniref:ankyrin repeat-containing protein BDA1-like n=1 Tax=Pistacia vera TaxID=55513 RepID=UPI00126338FD|nr:ankyrin repeat-containing protein BDA1-like [Pistacia vera]